LKDNLFKETAKMKFSKTPPELFAFIDNAVKDFKCDFRNMFGGIAYFVNGNMFTGAHQDVLFLRLPEGDRKSIMKEYDEVSPFEPMPGRQMSEYIAVPESVFSQPDMLQKWLDKSYSYVSSLSPKIKKRPKRKSVRARSSK
jgi:TfoX/Sxy family transcriptional regulator of competence genes